MKGNITRRGKNSFRLKFDAGIDANGKRKIQYHTFRGSKREAQDKLTELMASFGRVLTSRQARPWWRFCPQPYRPMGSIRQNLSGHGSSVS